MNSNKTFDDYMFIAQQVSYSILLIVLILVWIKLYFFNG